MLVTLPAEFRPVCRYVMRAHRPQDFEILDEQLWNQSGVVYARVYQNKVVYIGATDGPASRRLTAHVNGIAASMRGTAPACKSIYSGRAPRARWCALRLLTDRIRPPLAWVNQQQHLARANGADRGCPCQAGRSVLEDGHAGVAPGGLSILRWVNCMNAGGRKAVRMDLLL